MTFLSDLGALRSNPLFLHLNEDQLTELAQLAEHVVVRLDDDDDNVL